MRGPTLLFSAWAALTAGLAELFRAPQVVWPLSAGLFAIGLFGIRRAGIMLWLGLETLEHVKPEARDD